MPRSTKPGWVDWKKHPAREIILQDLEHGGPLHQRDNISAEDIFPWYKKKPAFADVVFEQFKARLKDHRKAVNEVRHRSLQEKMYVEHDRLLNPRQTHNERGELVFDMHPAKLLLRDDLQNNLLGTKFKTVRKLQDSRPQYLEFSRKTFHGRVRQEIKRSKYFYSLRLKREQLRNKIPTPSSADNEENEDNSSPPNEEQEESNDGDDGDDGDNDLAEDFAFTSTKRKATSIPETQKRRKKTAEKETASITKTQKQRKKAAKKKTTAKTQKKKTTTK